MSNLGGGNLGGGGGGGSTAVAWGGVTGTLANQTDLQSALDGITAGAGAVVARADITGLTGGTGADLDGILTVDLDAGTTVLISASAEPVPGAQVWVLTAATTAEDEENGIVRPNDYATTTNEKVWVRVL